MADLILWSLASAFVGFGVGYHYGKKWLFELLHQHMESNNRTGEEAIAYEEAVFKGKVPNA